MKLEGIVSLYKSMTKQNIDRYRFEFKFNQALFDVFFFIDSVEYLLLFGTKGDNFSFEIPVKKGFEISTMLDKNDYSELCRVLVLKYDPLNPFSTKKFFNDFNYRIPEVAFQGQKAEPQDIANYTSIIEEANKKYFLGWRDNTIRGNDVSDENLDKTKRLLGYKAYVRCKERNISSCWTDEKSKAKQFHMP